MIDLLLRRVAREYNLGEPLDQESLSGGSAPAWAMNNILDSRPALEAAIAGAR